MFKQGDIITNDIYTQAAIWCNQNNAKIEKQNNQFVIVSVPQAQLTYREKRAENYPSVGDQLDMIYWDKKNGTSNWSDTITAIKAKYPKE